MVLGEGSKDENGNIRDLSSSILENQHIIAGARYFITK